MYRHSLSTCQRFAPSEMVDRAAALGPELLAAVGEHTVGAVTSGSAELDWTSLRARAFRLLTRAYEELRRSTTYVRWYQGDAAAFAPSLHARGTSSRSSSAEEAEGDEGNGEGDDVADASGVQPAAAASTATAQSASTGLPGNSPFAS